MHITALTDDQRAELLDPARRNTVWHSRWARVDNLYGVLRISVTVPTIGDEKPSRTRVYAREIIRHLLPDYCIGERLDDSYMRDYDGYPVTQRRWVVAPVPAAEPVLLDA